MPHFDTPWTMCNVLCESARIIIVFSSPKRILCEPKIRDIVAQSKKTGTYCVVVEGHPDEDLDDSDSDVKTACPSDHSELIANVTLEEAKRHWDELCASYHNHLNNREHFELRVAALQDAKAEGESARAKLVLLEMQYLFPALFVTPSRDTTVNDTFHTLKPVPQYEEDSKEVVYFDKDAHSRSPASTDLGDWALYVVSNKRLTKHTSLHSALIALQNKLNELPGAATVVGMFLARSSNLAMRTFMKAPEV
ncbi:hypothetical protein V5O48_014235 [Marasmius crinis-equi]|uniref:Uncharacterized protein n=1 Tax=Marasmius crinis-equi TaxID=585013 RepID=A0ABR3EXU9_9AGAR